MPRFLGTLALCALSTLVCATARAATTTYNINVVGFPTSLSGSFTLTFDPTQVYLTDTAAGLTVNKLSFTAGPSAFLYVPNSFGGILTIGGQLNGVSANQTGTNDYTLQIRDLLTSPVLTGFTVNQLGTNTPLTTSVGQVTVTQVATTPEPSSLLLLGTGLLGVVGVARKRFS